MDTRNPIFLNAYNDLVNAFFRFINVVNPAPSRDDQIRLICNSLNALVDMLGASSPAQNLSGSPVHPEASAPVYSEPERPVYQEPAVAAETSRPAYTEPAAPQPASAQAYEEQRYAGIPTLTADEVYRFIIRSLKKPEFFNGDTADYSEYPFLLEFSGEEGIFTLNPQKTGNATRDPNFAELLAEACDASVVVIEGNPTPANVIVASPGKIEKCTGAWEIISPLKLTAK